MKGVRTLSIVMPIDCLESLYHIIRYHIDNL